MNYNTMRLTEAPKEIASPTRKAWDALFDAYGHETFHPIEGRGVIIAVLNVRRSEAESILQSMLDRSFAIAP